jgi:hypothetical protein
LADTLLSRDRVVFEVYGAAMVEALLNPFGVVEAFDVVEQGGPQGGSSRPGRALMDPGKFAFDGGEEGLDCGVDAPIAVKWRSGVLLRLRGMGA